MEMQIASEIQIFLARLSLLATAAAIGAEVYKPNIVTDTLKISRNKLKLYITKILMAASKPTSFVSISHGRREIISLLQS